MSKLKPSISPFWYRRLCEGTIVLGLLVAVSYGFSRLLGDGTAAGTLIPLGAAGVGAIGAALAMVARAIPSPKHMTIAAWLVFLINTAIVVSLIVTTGGPTSPLGALWFLTALSTGFIGAGGVIVMSVVSTVYIVMAFLSSWWHIPGAQFIIVYLASQLPLAVGLLFWRTGIFSELQTDETISHLSARLSREATKSEIIIKFIADGVMVIDKKGLIQLINPAAQRLTGWEEGEANKLDYRSVLKLSDNKDRDLADGDPIQQVLRTNKTVVNNDLTLTTRANKKALLSLVISPLGDETQGIVGVVAVFRDVTKEKAEEREKAEFVSTAAHEMRTPVATIEGYLALVMNPNVVQMDDKGRAYLTKAHEATQHLGRLFQDLLTISKAEDGRLANNPQPVEVVAFVQKLWEGQQPKAAAKKLEYVFGPDQDGAEANKVVAPIFYANIDPDRLSEVVNNLIDNAIKYTAEGTVSVDVTAEPDEVLISVKDSGIGIAKEDMPHLFQKFYRVDSSYTREVGGTGLGLYICRRIMEQSGGRLWVESELGKGSTFFVQIPRISSEDAERMRAQMAATQAVAAQKAGGAPATPAPVPVAAPAPAPVQQPPVAPPAPAIPAPAQPTAAPAAQTTTTQSPQ